MAHFTVNLFNSLAPRGRRVIVTGVLEQVDLQETMDGEVIWVLRMETNINGIGGQPIDPVYINDVTEETLSDEIRRAISIIAPQIDWGVLGADSHSPYIIEVSPEDQQEDVSIHANVKMHIRDAFPTVGIDPSTIKLRVNNIDVTPDLRVTGIDNEYKITWVPPRKLD